MKIIRFIGIKLIRFYQLVLSPLNPPSCRYYPTCSHYAFVLLQFDNIFLAIPKILYRILTCNPLFKGGFAFPSLYLNPTLLQQNQFISFQQKHFLSKPVQQRPKKITYFFIKSDSYLLKLQKFYIISVYLNSKGF